MYQGLEIGKHDRRTTRDGWTYYVRAVKRRANLTGHWLGWVMIGNVVFASVAPSMRDQVGLQAFLAIEGCLLILMIALLLVLRTRLRRAPWVVAVVRMGDVSTWNDISAKVVHSERLASDADLDARIAELVSAVEAGEYHPA